MWETIIQELARGGPVVVLLVVIFGILAVGGAALGWWVWGYVYRDLLEEMKFWRDKAFDLAGLGEQVAKDASELLEDAA